jgi:hypothetical protein
MSHDADPAGIQRNRESAVTGSSPAGIAASPGPALPLQPLSDVDLRLSGASWLLRRFSFLGVGLALGAVFSLWVAGPMMGSGIGSANWAIVMGGPIGGTAWGMCEYYPIILVGWLGLLLIPAHPCCPHPATGCVTLLGFALWFFAGFLTLGVAYGA